MTAEAYLHKLRQHLKGFPTQDQEVLIEEIRTHIESGEEDALLGQEPVKRQAKVMAEMGLPEQLGRDFQNVHRPNRLVDFLLVAVPPFIILPLVYQVYDLIFSTLSQTGITGPWFWLYTRMGLLFSVLFLLINARRRSTLALLFWLSETILGLANFMTWRWFFANSRTMANPIEITLWTTVFVAVIYWFVRLVWQNRRDLLLVTFALLPILYETCLTATILGRTFFVPIVWGWPITLIIRSTCVVWFALFIFHSRRVMRWAALGLIILTYSFMNAVELGLNPSILWVWLIPFILILFAWWVEQHRRMFVSV